MLFSSSRAFLFCAVLLSILMMLSRGVLAADGVSDGLPRDDEAFLDSIQRQAFEYFLKEYDPRTGLVYDGSTHYMGASIAATGFGLSALCVGESRGWISRGEAYNRVLTTLKTFHRDRLDPKDIYAEGYFGLFFHFLDPDSGKWLRNADCVSTADTADLIAGVITCMEYFKGTEVERIGDAIVRACEWDKFLYDNDGTAHPFIAMGYIPPDEPSTWTQATGFFGRYHGYRDNSFLIDLLAISSPLHPIPAEVWYINQNTYMRQVYNQKTVIATAPPGLAFHYYPHCWLDLRSRKDQVVDYFRNSQLAVLAQQEYCAASDNYQDGLWGISSCLSLRGYEALGAPFGGTYDNGTVTSHAFIGGIVFTPEASLNTMKNLAAYYDGAIMGKYGFTDSFNQKRGWVSREYLGIDQGIIVLMIENFRTGLIWKYFTRNQYIQEALKRIGFAGIIEDFESEPGTQAYSSFDIPAMNAIAGIVDNISADGSRSLRIMPKDGRGVTISIRPLLRDFSSFRFCSLWTRNAETVELKIVDKGGNAASFDIAGALESAGWIRYYYEFTRKDYIDLCNIEEVILTIKPQDGEGSGAMYIDGILLNYEKADVNPPPIRYLDISAVKDYAICRVAFERASSAHRYDIRYSTRPIRGTEDFEKLKASDAFFIASGLPAEEFFVPLPTRDRYYIGVRTVDRLGQYSGVVSVGPVMVDSAASRMVLDDFENSYGMFGPMEWAACKSHNVTVTKECASQGKCAVRIDYDKTKGSEWTYVEMRFRKPLDVRPFRHLKVDVQGSDNILAKLYTTKEWQEDIGTLTPLKEGEWNELVFDLSAMSSDFVDKARINKIIFFIAPGRIASGTMYLDNIRLDNSTQGVIENGRN